MKWFKFRIADYRTQTTHLSDAEDLAYRRLLDLYYMGEEMLPLDTALVARKIGLDLDITESVLGDFFERLDDGYFHQQADEEITRHNRQVENNRRLGKRGGRPPATQNL